jgi:membrane associated rhomboid family serine protease
MYYQRHGSGFGGFGLTHGVKNLLYANGIIFLIYIFSSNVSLLLREHFVLYPYQVIYQFKIWQLVTYMFLHGGFLHIFFNMFMLWMFGTEIEREWGTREFLKYYFICGIGAGITLIILSPHSATIGASGAVYGIMVAYAVKYPNRPIFLYFLFPIPAKYFVAFLVLVSFFSTIHESSDGIAHAAHFGGAIIGYVFLKYRYYIYKLKNILKQQKKKQKFKYTQGAEEKAEYYRRKIDEILDKINRVGYLNLTDEEKEILEKGSKYLREHDGDEFH